jgi:hypothetical protein
LTTNLTAEEQSAILYWPRIAHIGIIPADTRTKTVAVNEWPKLDLDNVDYETQLQDGLYDNGIAIRLGKTLVNGSGGSATENSFYSIALDFDGEDALLAWFGSWEEALKAAKKTRIEWHKNKARVHCLFLANRPIANRKISIKNS